MDMLLYLTCHPLVSLVEHILNRLPVDIRNLDRNLQLGWGFLQKIIDVLVDGIYFTADTANGIVKDYPDCMSTFYLACFIQECRNKL